MASQLLNNQNRGGRSGQVPHTRQLDHYHLPLQVNSSLNLKREPFSAQGTGNIHTVIDGRSFPGRGSGYEGDPRQDLNSPATSNVDPNIYRRNALSRSSFSQGRRRLSHSPVSVNTTYELGQKNTEKLWKEFNNHLRQSSNSLGSQGRAIVSKYQSSQNCKKNSPIPLMRFSSVRVEENSPDITPQMHQLQAQETRNTMNVRQENPSFGEDGGTSEFASIEKRPENSAYHTQQDLKLQLYKSSGLNLPTDESKNKVMLGTRLKEIFQASYQGGGTSDAIPTTSFQMLADDTRSRPLKLYDRTQRSSMSPSSLPRDSIQTSIQKIDYANASSTLSARQESASKPRNLYKKYIDINNNDRRSNGSVTQSIDFKSKVQQKILEMSQDLKNPSPIRMDTQSNLDGYIKNSNKFICFFIDLKTRINITSMFRLVIVRVRIKTLLTA